jgi:hypothetical protein
LRRWVIFVAAACGLAVLPAAACQDSSTGCCLVCNGTCACGNSCVACSARCTQPKGCACTAGPQPQSALMSLLDGGADGALAASSAR